MAVLVTGGAGYIGSVTVASLQDRGEETVVLDDLSRGNRAAVDANTPFYEASIGDARVITEIVRKHGVIECIHFAAVAYVGESISSPAIYFERNVEQSIRLLHALMEGGVRRFVFSSSCATYGEPQSETITEDHSQTPTSPYGWSKLFIEKVLESYNRAYGLEFVILRYFNAAGASDRHGEYHNPETHLIPNVLRVAAGMTSHLSVFGHDYPTRDGSAVRDYVHVTDLADAHLRALDHLRTGGESEAINLGNGNGYSVLEVVESARRVTGKPIHVKFEPRRNGDPSRVVAGFAKARRLLKWEPRYTNLDEIVRTAWNWQAAHPNGYSSYSLGD